MHSLGLGGLDFTPSHTLDEHRPDGFKTSDIVNSFTADYSENDLQQQEKVTVSINSISEDHARSSHQNDVLPPSTEYPERNRRAESHHYHHHPQEAEQDIISSSDQIKHFNELTPEVNNTKENSTSSATDQADVSSSSNSGEDDSGNWHNEIWQEIIFKEIHDPLHRHPRRDGESQTSFKQDRLFNYFSGGIKVTSVT